MRPACAMPPAPIWACSAGGWWSVSPIAASSRLGDRVMRFAERYPRVRIDVESGIDREFVARLHRGEIDVAISSQTAEQTTASCLLTTGCGKLGRHRKRQ